MPNQVEFARLLDEVMDEDKRITDETLAKLKALQPEYFAVIRSYTRADGTINPSRINSLYRDLEALEGDYRAVLEESVEQGVSAVTKVTVAYLISRYFSNGIRTLMDIDTFTDNRNLDGLTLGDRSRIMGGDLTDSIRRKMRRSIYQGATASDLYDSVIDSFEDEEWKAKRLVTSEMNNSYRGQFAETLKNNGEEYVQFYESQWCTHKRHNTHKCHLLANEDRYGLGAGVFKVTDSEIYSPHPQCRGYLGLYGGGE